MRSPCLCPGGGQVRRALEAARDDRERVHGRRAVEPTGDHRQQFGGHDAGEVGCGDEEGRGRVARFTRITYHKLRSRGFAIVGL